MLYWSVELGGLKGYFWQIHENAKLSTFYIKSTTMDIFNQRRSKMDFRLRLGCANKKREMLESASTSKWDKCDLLHMSHSGKIALERMHMPIEKTTSAYRFPKKAPARYEIKMCDFWNCVTHHTSTFFKKLCKSIPFCQSGVEIIHQ